MPSGHTPFSVLVTVNNTLYRLEVSLSSSWLRLTSPVERSIVKRSERGEEKSGEEGKSRGREWAESGEEGKGVDGQGQVSSKYDQQVQAISS